MGIAIPLCTLFNEIIERKPQPVGILRGCQVETVTRSVIRASKWIEKRASLTRAGAMNNEFNRCNDDGNENDLANVWL
jgi:hypothetical protein